MKLMILNVPHDPTRGFDGEAAAARVGDREIVRIVPIPWTRDGVPGLTLVLGVEGEPRRPRSADEWRDQLAARDRPVFDALRDWRKRTAADRELAAFVICPNATLARVAALRPRDADELLAVPGVGPLTAERYGDGLLEAVRAGDEAAAAQAGRAPAAGAQ